MPLDIGSRAPAFTLPGTDGADHSYDGVAGERMTLIVFSCNHCPYVHAYEPRLIGLIREFAPRGLGAALICSNNAVTHPQDGFDNMKARAREQGYPCPYLRDETQEVAKAYAANRTPEVFLFDAEGVLRYQGGIDDKPYEPESVTQTGLRDAIEALLAGRPVPVQKTPPQGCTIKWK